MKLSVCMITFNHARYIKQAIDSILMQNCSFDYEIVIGDDASTDNTRNILQDYRVKYPEKIKLVLHNNNIGMLSNFTETINKCTGKYIAILEGDDYWTDPYKLQNQVDFLDANPDYGLVSSSIECVDENNQKLDNHPYILPEKHRFPDDSFWVLLKKNYIYTLTVCTRKDFIQKLTNRIFGENLSFPYDYWFWLNISLDSKIKIMDIPTACYRIHNYGISRNQGFFNTRRILVKTDLIKTLLSKKNIKLNTEQKKIILRVLINITKNKDIPFKLKTSFLFFLTKKFKKLF